jgi:hypothetical protein
MSAEYTREWRRLATHPGLVWVKMVGLAWVKTLGLVWVKTLAQCG